MYLSVLTAVHTAISLLGIGSGFVVLYGLMTSRSLESWTRFFLATTAVTSLTGFLFPVHALLPSHVVGIISIVDLTIASLALYRFLLAGGWRRTYVITAVIALYLNVFVLIAQLFQKVPSLKQLAPTQSEPPFQIAQLVVLVVFVALGFRAAIKFDGGHHG